MRKILMLGGSHFQIPAIKYARDAGYYVITADFLPDNPGHKYSHEYHNVSTVDKEAVLRLTEKISIDGIISYATDASASTAANVAEKMGLAQSKYIDPILESRKSVSNIYTTALKKINGLSPFIENTFSRHNNSFYPVIIDEDICGVNRDGLNTFLNKHNIFPRKYFYPLLSEFGMYRNMPSSRNNKLHHAHELSNNVLCSPIYPDLAQEEQGYVIEKIVGLIKELG